MGARAPVKQVHRPSAAAAAVRRDLLAVARDVDTVIRGGAAEGGSSAEVLGNVTAWPRSGSNNPDPSSHAVRGAVQRCTATLTAGRLGPIQPRPGGSNSGANVRRASASLFVAKPCGERSWSGTTPLLQGRFAAPVRATLRVRPPCQRLQHFPLLMRAWQQPAHYGLAGGCLPFPRTQRPATEPCLGI